MIPAGKGIMICTIRSCLGGDVKAIAARLLDMGMTWAAVKITDGNYYYNFDYKTGTDYVPGLKDALGEVGIKLHGWGYAYGYSPADEARVAVDRTHNLGLESFAADVEGEFKKQANAKQAAEVYMGRMARMKVPVGLCSYRFPTLHPELPWEIFLEGCDYHNPQVYWAGADNAGEQLARSVKELRALKEIPVVPVGSAYHEHGWAPTVAQLDDFHQRVMTLKLQGESWWVLDYDHVLGHQDWSDAIKAHQWESSSTIFLPIVNPNEERKYCLYRVTAYALNVRAGPSRDNPNLRVVYYGDMIKGEMVQSALPWVKFYGEEAYSHSDYLEKIG